MSAYASLPGSFLPPFFAFGALAGTGDEGTALTTDGGGGSPASASGDTSCAQPTPTTARSTIAAPAAPSSSSYPPSPSSDVDVVPAFKALALARDDRPFQSPPPSPPPSPSHPSDIIIAFQSARVDPVALIRSLTSKGSNIARRTANFIARTPAVSEEDTDANTESPTTTSDDAVSAFSGPELCYEDSDSDEEYSMYDYSEDFSTPDDCHEEPEVDHSSDGDPSSIEFELSICFQGRKYNATRAFPTFVKLRSDLLREINEGGDGEAKQGTRFRRRRSSGTKSPGAERKNLRSSQSVPDKLMTGGVSVPELPRVCPRSVGHGGYCLSGVARSGFALLQATAQHYCPEMEGWMRHVIEAFPYSQSLSSFLWEPLSSTDSSWDNIGEGKEMKSSCDNGQSEKSSLSNASSRPSLYRSRSRSSGSAKSNPFKSQGSMGSLNSIDEGDGYESDHSI
ncbi:hypothetical protein ACHAWF_013503 [Thalassiosira exigua]